MGKEQGPAANKRTFESRSSSPGSGRGGKSPSRGGKSPSRGGKKPFNNDRSTSAGGKEGF